MVSPRSRATLQIVASGARIGGEEGEVNALELIRANAFDEIHLVANGFELSERLVVVEKADVDRGKITLP